MKNEKEILSIQEIAKYLNVNTKTIRKMIDKKKIPFFRVGWLYRFKMSEISEWIKGRNSK